MVVLFQRTFHILRKVDARVFTFSDFESLFEASTGFNRLQKAVKGFENLWEVLAGFVTLSEALGGFERISEAFRRLFEVAF